MKRKKDSPKSPHRRTPPPNQFASSSQRPLRSNFLPNSSSPDSPKSSVASSSDSGKMSLNFLNDIPWTMETDIILFGQLKKARTQQDDYLGLSWNDEMMWQQICSKVKAEAPLICDLVEIKDRVKKYKSSYKQNGDDVFRGNFELRMLAKDVFDKSTDIGPPIVPLSLSRSRTTSYSGQLSIGASTARGGGNSSQYDTLMSELQKMTGPNPTDITLDEFTWAVDHFNYEGGLSIFFGLDPQERLAYIKRFAKK